MTRETGFPSPAQGYEATPINLNDELIKNKESTFILSLEESSLKKYGVLDNSILIVDRSIKPRDGDIVVALVEGEFICRIFYKKGGRQGVSNGEFVLLATGEVEIFGTVTYVIKKVHK